MSYLWSLYITHTFEIDRAGAKVVEHAYATTDQDWGNVDGNFVNQAGLDRLLQDAGCANDHILIPCGLLCLANGTFHAVGDKGEWRTWLHPFLRDVVSHDERRRSGRIPTPGLCDVKGSASPDAGTILADGFLHELSTLL